MGFDPVSFSAGIGAGQEATNRANSAAQNAEHDAAMARIQAESARIQADSARSSANTSQDVAMIAMMGVQAKQNEINKKWIPYGVRMQASIFANRTQKEDLIAALKATDPTNADRIVAESEKRADAEYARLTAPGSEALKMINETVQRKAEEGRLDR